MLQQLATSQVVKARKQAIDFVVDVPPELPENDVDPERVVQVISTLLNNTLNFTPSGGRIRLTGRSCADRHTVVFCV